MFQLRRGQARAVQFLPAILLAILLFIPTLAAAQSVDPFTVEAVRIDATAKNPQAARKKALDAGQVVALKMLLRRLTRRADHGRLPEPDETTMPDMVDAFTVSDEKLSSVRYIAKLSVRFKPERVRQMLKNAEVPFVDAPTVSVLVVPVFVAGDTRVLWETPNPWREAWNRAPLGGGLVPVVLPLGDLEDIQAIDAKRALARDVKALGELAKRYKAAQVLLLRVIETGGSANKPKLSIVAWRYNPIAKVLEKARRFPRIAGADRAETFMNTALGIVRRMERRWVEETLSVNAGSPQKLRARAPIESLRHWTELRERLSKVAGVRSTRVLSLAREAAEIEIEFLGDLPRLQAGLAQQDLTLSQAQGQAGSTGGNGSASGGSTGGASGAGGSSAGGSAETGGVVWILRIRGGFADTEQGVPKQQ